MKYKNWFVFRVHITVAADGVSLYTTDTQRVYHIAAPDARAAIDQAIAMQSTTIRSRKKIDTSPYWIDGDLVPITSLQVTNCTQVCPISYVCEPKGSTNGKE